MGISRRLGGEQIGQRRHGQRGPQIARGGLPAGKHQATAGCGQAVKMSERGLRVGKEHHAKTRQDEIEAGFICPRRRIGGNELGLAQQGLGACPGAGQQRLGYVEANRMAALPHHGIHGQRGLASAAPDIEHQFAKLRAGGGEQSSSDRGERQVHALLHLHPDIANLAVPIINLFGIAHGG